MRLSRIFIISLLFATVCSSGSQLGSLKVDRLRCEYMENPLGIDEMEPRLSWIVTSGARGQKQSAYQIRVASSLEKLLSGNGDLWGSGKVSRESLRGEDIETKS